jgi:stearoyl-CoA desaturase (delta-9 desaturase)
VLRGLGNAHLAWMFRGRDMANPARYARDLLGDRDCASSTAILPLWVAAGPALPFGLGFALTGSITGGLTGLLCGGAVRVFLVHHVTSASTRCVTTSAADRSPPGDPSRHLAWLAPLAFGEACHNNHHAFPASVRHALGRRRFDPGAWLITGLERFHLAWDVIRISPARPKPNVDPRQCDATCAAEITCSRDCLRA